MKTLLKFIKFYTISLLSILTIVLFFSLVASFITADLWIFKDIINYEELPVTIRILMFFALLLTFAFYADEGMDYWNRL